MRKDLWTIVLILTNDVFLACSQKISSPRGALSHYKKLMKILGVNISWHNHFRQLWRAVAMGTILSGGPNYKRFERKNYRKTLEVNFKKMKRKYTWNNELAKIKVNYYLKKSKSEGQGAIIFFASWQRKARNQNFL